MNEVAEPGRIAWAVTGSGHYLRECLDAAAALGNADLYLSGAGEEVLQMYGHPLTELRRRFRVFRDNSASSPPVGLFYEQQYRAVVIAPATSNTVAKCVAGISDSLVTNIYAQAAKCRVPSIVFACDSAPVMETEAPSGPVMVYPRPIDLYNTERLAEFDLTTVVTDLQRLREAVSELQSCQSTCFS